MALVASVLSAFWVYLEHAPWFLVLGAALIVFVGGLIFVSRNLSDRLTDAPIQKSESTTQSALDRQIATAVPASVAPFVTLQYADAIQMSQLSGFSLVNTGGSAAHNIEAESEPLGKSGAKLHFDSVPLLRPGEERQVGFERLYWHEGISQYVPQGAVSNRFWLAADAIRKEIQDVMFSVVVTISYLDQNNNKHETKCKIEHHQYGDPQTIVRLVVA